LESEKNNRKSTVFSSRLENNVYDKLTKTAESKGVTANFLLNNILKQHLIRDQFFDDMNMIAITKRTLKKIFRTMDDEEIEKIAVEVGGTVPQELIYLSYNQFDFENLMKMVEVSNSRFGTVKYTVNDSKHNINILHGICRNFSKFIAETHQTMAKNLSIPFNVQHLDDHMVCIEFEKPNIS
jgi:hypothetical protein